MKSFFNLYLNDYFFVADFEAYSFQQHKKCLLAKRKLMLKSKN